MLPSSPELDADLEGQWGPSRLSSGDPFEEPLGILPLCPKLLSPPQEFGGSLSSASDGSEGSEHLCLFGPSP